MSRLCLLEGNPWAHQMYFTCPISEFQKISVDLVNSDFVAGLIILYEKHNRKRAGNSRCMKLNFKGQEVKLLTYLPVPENMQFWQDNNWMKIKWAKHFIKYGVGAY